MFRFDRSSQQQSVYQSKQMYNNQQKSSYDSSFQQRQQNFLQQRSSANVLQQMQTNKNTQRKCVNKFEEKDQGKQTNRSPYRPKLVQHLMDSSDQDNNSYLSDQDNYSNQSDQYEQERCQEPLSSNKLKFENKNDNHQDRMGKSFFTNRTQQTAFSKATKVSAKTSAEVLKKVANNFVPNSQSYSSSSVDFISKNDKKPGLQIKYDTLKLSHYDTKQAQIQNELYLKNRKDFQQNMPITKIKLTQQLYRSNLFESNKENQNMIFVDSLEEMKKNEQKKSNFERKLMVNSTISLDKSQAMKSVSEIIKNQQLDDQQELNISRNYSKVQQLNLQLKRSKDVIKTLTLKNNDLQKTLQMQTVQLQQLQGERSSQLQQQQKRKHQQIVEKTLYERINQFMRVIVKQFMQDVKDIKMSPILEQSLQQFMAQLLQVDAFSVNKKLGITNQLRQNIVKNRDSQTLLKSEKISTRFTKIVKESSTQNIKTFNQQQDKPPNRNQNQFKSATQQTNNIRPSNNRSNAFMTNQSDQSNSNRMIKGGTTIKLDLSSNKQNHPSNKENITPNKKVTADEQFRLLEKSLQKLKNMQKQLQSASPAPKLSTPVPKRQTTALGTKYHFETNEDDDEQRSQYSLINRRQFSTINDNSQMNKSTTNLDRSKSRRKKIFAQTIRNQ